MIDLVTYSQKMIEYCDQLKNMTEEDHEKAVPIMEKCIWMNYDILKGMDTVDAEELKDTLTEFRDDTISMIDNIIECYQALNRPIQVHNFELLKREIDSLIRVNKPIRVVV